MFWYKKIMDYFSNRNVFALQENSMKMSDYSYLVGLTRLGVVCNRLHHVAYNVLERLGKDIQNEDQFDSSIRIFFIVWLKHLEPSFRILAEFAEQPKRVFPFRSEVRKALEVLESGRNPFTSYQQEQIQEKTRLADELNKEIGSEAKFGAVSKEEEVLPSQYMVKSKETKREGNQISVARSSFANNNSTTREKKIITRSQQQTNRQELEEEEKEEDILGPGLKCTMI
eukprot:TRINITY_DN8159_c0_g3_i1.p1 TRINITY_DN8159_c0_g3~~TRINITY_DN8159_c0_g3_i1.p1  ORF type:complete len:227 (+),score=44.35 TRINITY_DN8159_c0_g3_i1:198-878(+)